MWSLFFFLLLFLSKKKTKNQLQNEQSTRSIAAHTSVKTYCGVQRLAWKWKWQWREHECERERKHKPCYPQRQTHMHMHTSASPYVFVYEACLSVCVRVCVCVCERRAHKMWDSAHTSASVYQPQLLLLLLLFFLLCVRVLSQNALSLSLYLSQVFGSCQYGKSTQFSVTRWVIWYKEILFEHEIGIWGIPLITK